MPTYDVYNSNRERAEFLSLLTTVPASSKLQNDSDTSRLLSNVETPKVEKASRSAAASKERRASGAKRNNGAVFDLREQIPQLPPDFFLGQDGILPPLDDKIDVSAVVQKLQANNHLKIGPDGRGRWEAYPPDPSNCRDREDIVFRHLAEIAGAIENASGIDSIPTLSFKCNPGLTPASSTCDNDTRPDCYSLLKNIPTNVISGAPYWVDIAVPGGFKKSTADGPQVSPTMCISTCGVRAK